MWLAGQAYWCYGSGKQDRQARARPGIVMVLVRRHKKNWCKAEKQRKLTKNWRTNPSPLKMIFWEILKTLSNSERSNFGSKHKVRTKQQAVEKKQKKIGHQTGITMNFWGVVRNDVRNRVSGMNQKSLGEDVVFDFMAF